MWSVEPKSDKAVDGKISISSKSKDTGEYIKEFTGFVRFLGTACAKRAMKLKEGDSIKLRDVDVSRTWDAENKKEYTNFKIFSFTTNDENESGSVAEHNATESTPEPDDSDLPF